MITANKGNEGKLPFELREEPYGEKGSGKDIFRTLNRRAVGAAGEELAAAFLKERGFTLLERNFMTRRGEIDIIASREGVLHFVEVKYRRNLNWGHPAEAVTPRKLQRIQMAMGYYLYKKRLNGVPVQIDVIGIVGKNIEWMEAVVLM